MFLVPAVRDAVVAPVGPAVTVVETAFRLPVGIMPRIAPDVFVAAPGLPVHRPVVVPAGAPAEKVHPAVPGGR